MAEHGHLTVVGTATPFGFRTPTMTLRKELGMIKHRGPMRGKPGKQRVAEIATGLEHFGDTKFDRNTPLSERVAAIEHLSTGDLAMMGIAFHIDRVGRIWDYPWSITCGRCGKEIHRGTVKVDLGNQKVIIYPTADGAVPQVVYSPLNPFQLPGRNESVSSFTMQDPPINRAVIPQTEIEWRDDKIADHRVVPASIVQVDGKVTVVTESTLGDISEADFGRMKNAVEELTAGPINRAEWMHEACGGNNLIATDWRTDFG